LLAFVLGQEVVEELVASSLSRLELMGVPELRVDRLDVVLVHCEFGPVEFGALKANERSESDVEVGRFIFLAVDTELVVLVFLDDGV